jgi:hypothetical protein
MSNGDVLNQLNLLGQKASTNTGNTLTSVGTASTTGTVDVGATFSETTINNNFATVVKQLNAMRAVLVAAGLMT